jgi:20S proteasome subunit alpha 7
LKSGSNKQLHTLGPHHGMAFSGWAPDARQLIDRGRSEVQNYEETYGSEIPAEILAERMAQYVHYFTLHGALRPFGVGAIVAAYDPETKNHALHMIEPNGVQYRYFGAALGKVRPPVNFFSTVTFKYVCMYM